MEKDFIKSMKNPFQHKKTSAYEAIHEAHKIAFGGMVFQAVRCMRDLGILKQLEDNHDSGISAEDVAEQLGLNGGAKELVWNVLIKLIAPLGVFAVFCYTLYITLYLPYLA